MMRLARRAALLVAFSLLASAATAHADCAWVLWSQLGLKNEPSVWLVNRAYDSSTECKAAAVELIRLAAARGETVDAGSVLTPKGFLVPTCLPDTVDPRGPKGRK
jgi:hypothetical protein